MHRIGVGTIWCGRIWYVILYLDLFVNVLDNLCLMDNHIDHDHCDCCVVYRPPGNTSYVAPKQDEVDAYLSRACSLLPPVYSAHILAITCVVYFSYPNVITVFFAE